MTDLSWIGGLNVDDFCHTQMLKEQSQLQKQSTGQISQLTLRQTAVNTQISMYSQLSSLLQTFQNNLTQLTNSFSANYTVASSNSNTATAQLTSSTTASAGSHTITVSQLAQGSSTASSNFNSINLVPPMTNTLTLGIGGTNFNVNIGPSDTLTTIAASINSNAAVNGVALTASVVSTGTNQYRLVVSSNQTGLANAVTISETGTGTNALGISTGAGGTGTVLLAAQDAKFKFDTLDFVSASNSNIPTVSGLNVNISAVNADPTYITVSATNQVANVTSAAQNLVSSYNQILTMIQQFQATITAPPTDAATVPVMSQDSTLASVQAALQNAMGVGTSAYQALTSIGIGVAHSTTQTITLPNSSRQLSYKLTGLLQINTDSTNGQPTLASSLATNFSNVQSVLTDSNTGIATNLSNLIKQPGAIWKALNDTSIGAIPKANKQLNQVTNDLLAANQKETDLETALIAKYANLEVSLTLLQNTSIYISQTVSMMTK